MPKFRPDQIVKALPQPIHGVVRSIDRSNPDPQSAISSLNVLPYGPWDGFRRVTTRPDTSVFGDLSTSTDIQGLLPIGFVIQPGGTIAGSSTYNLLDFFGISSFGSTNSTWGPVTFNVAPGGPFFVQVNAATATTAFLGFAVGEIELDVSVNGHLCGSIIVEAYAYGNLYAKVFESSQSTSITCSAASQAGVSGTASLSIKPAANNLTFVATATIVGNGQLTPSSGTATSTFLNTIIPIGNTSYQLSLTYTAPDNSTTMSMS
jgi:hypothetical protein